MHLLREESVDYEETPALAPVPARKSNADALRKDRVSGNINVGDWVLYVDGHQVKSSPAIQDILHEDKKIRRIRGQISTLISRTME